MSKLDDIFRRNAIYSKRAKQQVKDLMIELIGPDVPTMGAQNEAGHIAPEDYEAGGGNAVRRELRDKVDEL